MDPTEPIGYLLGAKARPMALQPGEQLTLGREPTNQIFLEDAHASRLHAVVQVNGAGVVFVKDLGSTNGTYLNNERLKADEPRPLHSGDSIRIGGRMISYVGSGPGVEPALEEVDAAEKLVTMRTLEAGYIFKDGKVIPDHEQPPPPEDRTLPPSADLVATEEGLPPMAQLSLAGNLNDQSLPQVLQFLHTTARTGELEVRGGKMKGTVGFQKGQAVFGHAMALSGDTFAFSDQLDTSGAEAVYQLCRFKEGTFHFKPLDEVKRPRNITIATMSVIFEACRRMDEASRG